MAQWVGEYWPRPSDALLAELAKKDTTKSSLNGKDLADWRPPAHLGPDHLAEGRQALHQEQYGEALHHFGQLLDEQPNHAWAHHGRGDTLLMMGEAAAALIAYQNAANMRPDEGIHHAGVANAMQSLGQVAEANVKWAKALALDPSLTWMRDGQPPPDRVG